MELASIRTLLALAQKDSISAAARALNFTPSAAHKQLRALERELGVKVYQRHGQNVELTDAGKLLIPHFQAALQRLDDAAAETEALKGSRRGTVRLAGGPSMVHYLFPPLLRRYRQKFPGIDFAVKAGGTHLFEALRDHSVDLLFSGSEGFVPPDLRIEATWPYEFVFIANRRFTPGRVALSDLRKHPFVMFNFPFPALERYFAFHQFVPRIIMRFDSADAMKAMVESGIGISVLPLWAVNRDLREKRVLMLELREKPIFDRLALVRLESSYVSGPSRQFIQLAKQYGFGRTRLLLHKPPADWR